MTKVCHIITSLGEGGAQKILTSLSINNTSHEHFIISLKKGGRYTEILKKKGIKVFNLDFKRNKLNSLNSLLRRIECQEPEIIQTWMYHSDLISFYLYLNSKLNGRVIYWNIRNGFLKKESSKLLTRLIRKILLLI